MGTLTCPPETVPGDGLTLATDLAAGSCPDKRVILVHGPWQFPGQRGRGAGLGVSLLLEEAEALFSFLRSLPSLLRSTTGAWPRPVTPGHGHGGVMPSRGTGHRWLFAGLRRQRMQWRGCIHHPQPRAHLCLHRRRKTPGQLGGCATGGCGSHSVGKGRGGRRDACPICLEKRPL